ncbi:hypothetical protein [Methanosphaera cuniculi]|uniref:hypothetical protein n=1 Tax=Methanosphaera cuniculi TaxID=1077256 RepID=UPI0026EF7604|nr:hypothetical protein [Methanosphaera cuniculi]
MTKKQYDPDEVEARKTKEERTDKSIKLTIKGPDGRIKLMEESYEVDKELDVTDKKLDEIVKELDVTDKKLDEVVKELDVTDKELDEVVKELDVSDKLDEVVKKLNLADKELDDYMKKYMRK